MKDLRSFTAQSGSKLDILGLDSNTLCVDGSQISVFKESNKASFRCFLESTDGRGLESEVSLEVLSDFTDQTLERELADEEFS
jgi:hypothetical protein